MPDALALRQGIGIPHWEALAAVRLTTLGLTCACPKVSESERPFRADFGPEPRRQGRVSPKVRRERRAAPSRTTLRRSRLCATAAGPRATVRNRERASDDGRMVEENELASKHSLLGTCSIPGAIRTERIRHRSRPARPSLPLRAVRPERRPRTFAHVRMGLIRRPGNADRHAPDATRGILGAAAPSWRRRSPARTPCGGSFPQGGSHARQWMRTAARPSAEEAAPRLRSHRHGLHELLPGRPQPRGREPVEDRPPPGRARRRQSQDRHP